MKTTKTARGSSAIDYEHGEYRKSQAASAGDAQSGYRKEKGKYAGKTYDSVDSIAEFFKHRAQQLGNTSGSFQSTRERAEQEKSDRKQRSNLRGSSAPIRTGSGSDRVSSSSGDRISSDRVSSSDSDRGGSPTLRERSSQAQSPKTKAQSPLPSPSPTGPSPAGPSDFVPGSYVKHSKYGRGLVLHREGVGESLKLTVTFPGYGQKKLIQKYAGLEKA